MKLKLLFLFVCILFYFEKNYAQDPCGFDQYEQMILQLNPNYQSVKNQVEIDLKEVINMPNFQQFKMQNTASNTIFRIPIVFHLVGDYVISTITEAKIKEQVKILNECFRKTQFTNGYGDGVDTEVEFCLANIAPSGFSSNGINNIPGARDAWTYNSNSDNVTLKSLDQWSPESYLNVWVVKELIGATAYSSFPWHLQAKPELDGIVTGYNFLGLNNHAEFYQGKALVHEIGHWLGLYHTFERHKDFNTLSIEAECLNDDCRNNGDYCCDTPPVWNHTYGGPNRECPTGTNTCHSDYPDMKDQIQNYMDYTNDGCKNSFTFNQKERMWATLITTRSSLKNSPAACPQPASPPATTQGGGGGYSVLDPTICYTYCIPRSDMLEIYDCLKGKTDGGMREVIGGKIKAGTKNFNFSGGKVALKGSRVELEEGFKIDATEDDRVEICATKFVYSDLIDGINIFFDCYVYPLSSFGLLGDCPKCEKKTDKPCPIFPNLNKTDNIQNHFDNEISKQQNKNNDSLLDFIHISPNPNNGNFLIQTGITEIATIYIYDVLGNVVYQNSATGAVNIDISTHAKGIYFVKVFTGSGTIANKKIVYQ